MNKIHARQARERSSGEILNKARVQKPWKGKAQGSIQRMIR
jgi:hypothetical protein